jgi:transposase
MESGGDCRSVGKISGIAPSTAGNWHRRYRQTQSYAARPMGGDHRSRLIEYVDRIANLLAQTSDLTLIDVQAALARDGVHAAYATVASLAGQA